MSAKVGPAETPERLEVAELEECRKQIEAASADARALMEGLTEEQLNWRPEAGAWSMAECLDHLAVTGRQMCAQLREVIKEARSKGLLGSGPFRHGRIGDVIVRSMEPPPKRKFRAPAVFRPRPDLPAAEVSEGFFAAQVEILGLLREAVGVDLGRARVTSPVSRWVKYSLGQAFALIATHERRHLWQARQVREKISSQ